MERLKDEAFADLLEEGCRQAARSLSDERRKYIASLICGSVSPSRIRYVESRHLLRILNEINDIEIIWLRFYREPTMDGDEDFRNKHAEVLQRAVATFDSSPQEFDKSTLQTSYKEHLCQLDLLEARSSVDSQTNLPEFDGRSGKMKVYSYAITRLGRLLLREIGIGSSR